MCKIRFDRTYMKGMDQMSDVNIMNEVYTKEKVIAFTFDDGPSPIYTPQVLDIFKEAGGFATFFMIGEHMKKHPEIVKMVTEGNHEIGNHTYSHEDLTELSVNDAYKELEKSDQLTHQMAGKKPRVMRPPFIRFNNETKEISNQFNYRVIGAINGDAKDWEQPGVEHIVSKSRNHIRNGSILMFHDGFENRSQTIDAVRILVKEVKENGYRLVTVSQLLDLAVE